MCAKDPKVGKCLACTRNSRKICVGGASDQVGEKHRMHWRGGYVGPGKEFGFHSKCKGKSH